MKFEDTHGGLAGKSLAQKMRDRTDELYKDWAEDETNEHSDISFKQGLVEGACEMLAILTSTKVDLQWDSTEARYKDRKRQEEQANDVAITE